MSDQMPELGWTTDGRVSRILDGDTIEVEVTRKFVVRLRDCWAPEMESVEQLRRWGIRNIPAAPEVPVTGIRATSQRRIRNALRTEGAGKGSEARTLNLWRQI